MGLRARRNTLPRNYASRGKPCTHGYPNASQCVQTTTNGASVCRCSVIDLVYNFWETDEERSFNFRYIKVIRYTRRICMWTKSQVWIFEEKYRIIIFSCFSEIKSSWNYTVLYIYIIYISRKLINYSRVKILWKILIFKICL